ncbi:MAG: 30S ribosomal protein S15 [Candidatus Bathyarchaeota archaeon]|nr:30S ribosomal protein S15 [Candidatus Bathyarchaeota archaeon]
MPKKEKGCSHSIRPVGKRPPSWCKYTPDEIVALVIKLAREGNPPSKIGVMLRDQYGVPLVKALVGKSIIKILEENGLAPKIPEDLNNLLRKAARISAHLQKHRKDTYNRRALQIVESKIHRLSEYYKEKGVLPPNWEYKAIIASIR